MPAKLKSLNLNLPFGLGGVTVEIGQAEREAAWKLYVELSTRIASQPLTPDTGSVREALTSLYNVFDITRSILKEAGPEIGQGKQSFGALAIWILNDGLRPFLSRWHAAYGDFEAQKSIEMMKEHGFRNAPIALVDQSGWTQLDAFFEDLEDKRSSMRKYITELSRIAGVED